jgi:hypothetical protein
VSDPFPLYHRTSVPKDEFELGVDYQAALAHFRVSSVQEQAGLFLGCRSGAFPHVSQVYPLSSNQFFCYHIPQKMDLQNLHGGFQA